MSKEHSYAYEAGYRDGAINYELDHCPACKNVADLQEVLDENTKLRELVRQSIYAMGDADWASIVSAAIELGVEVDG